MFSVARKTQGLYTLPQYKTRDKASALFSHQGYRLGPPKMAGCWRCIFGSSRCFSVLISDDWPRPQEDDVVNKHLDSSPHECREMPKNQ